MQTTGSSKDNFIEWFPFSVNRSCSIWSSSGYIPSSGKSIQFNTDCCADEVDASLFVWLIYKRRRWPHVEPDINLVVRLFVSIITIILKIDLLMLHLTAKCDGWRAFLPILELGKDLRLRIQFVSKAFFVIIKPCCRKRYLWCETLFASSIFHLGRTA